MIVYPFRIAAPFLYLLLMKRDSVSQFWILAGFAYICCLPVCLADSEWKPPVGLALTSGMTDAEVIKAWGAPHRRDEKEVLRESVWYYGSRSLLFREGRLVLPSESVPNTTQSPKVSESKKRAFSEKRPSDSGKLKDVLSDISKLAGSPDSGSSVMPQVAPGFVIPTPVQAGFPPNFPQPNFNNLNANPPPGFPSMPLPDAD